MSNQVHRVVFVSTQMEAAGVQVLAVNLMEAFNDAGQQTEIVFLYKKREVFSGVPGITCLLDRPPRSPLDILIILARLVRELAKRRATAVVGWAHYSSPLAAIAGLITGARWRVGTQVSYQRNGNLKSVADYLDLLCGIAGIYTSNVAASHAIRTRFERYPARYKRTLKTIYNGVRWTPSKLSKVEARKVFGLPSDAELVINCGRLSRQKNQAFLLDVMARLPHVHLAILGEGELRGDLERRIAELGLETRVTLLGEVPPERVPDFLASGDVFAFPSLWEGFGLAVVEAMLAGVPVVASDHPVLREVIGEFGVLLPTARADEWAAQLDALLGRSAGLEATVDAAKNHAAQFGFDGMVDGFWVETLGSGVRR